MSDVTSVKQGSSDETMAKTFVIAFAILAPLAIFASGLAPIPDITKPLSPANRLLLALQKADWNLFMIHVARYPWMPFAAAALAVYGHVLYGIMRKRIVGSRMRTRALRDWPLVGALVGLVFYWVIDRQGLIQDNLLSLHNWRSLGAVIAALTACALVWLLAFTHPPRSLRALHRHPHLSDEEDLRGAAMVGDLNNDRHKLLLKFPGTDWPNLENSAVRRDLAGRTVIGRYREFHEETNLWVCPEISRSSHTLVVAPSGAGKTHSFAFPMTRDLPVHGHSVFMIDVKGDAASSLGPALDRRKIPFYSFNPLRSDTLRWNPMSEVNRSSMGSIYSGADQIARGIFGEISTHDKYWDLTELGYLRSTIELLLLTSAAPTLADIPRLLSSRERLEASLATAKAKIGSDELTSSCEYRDRVEEIERSLQLLLSDAEQKRMGYYERLQGVFNKLAPFQDERIIHSLQDSPFRLSRITLGASAMVFAAPLSLGHGSAALASVAVRRLQEVINARFEAPPKTKLFFILDEFSKLGLSAEETELFISTCRSAGCVSVIFLQSVDQIHERTRSQLLDNLTDRIILHGAGPATTKWFESTLHDRSATRATVSEQQAYSGGRSRTGYSTSVSESVVPVLREREIHNTGGLRHGAWTVFSSYSSKPILVDLWRPEGA